MHERAWVSTEDIYNHFSRISHLTESLTGYEPQMIVKEWNEQFFSDIRSEAEVLMLMHGQGTSDRFLYGVCSAVISMREENKGILPTLTDAQYELDKETQDSHQAAQDEAAAEYFSNLENRFGKQFPITATLLQLLEQDLKVRLHVPEEDIQEGFIPGWYKAVKVIIPLFAVEN
jgi:hypothetical protein